MTVAAPSADEQLDGTFPLAGATVRFDLLDATENFVGVLAVDRTRAPRISNSTSRSIRRSLNDVVVPARGWDQSDLIFADELDALGSRLQPFWVLPTGEEYSLGVFLWADDSSEVYTWGVPRTCSLVDKCLILEQQIGMNVGVGKGATVTDAMAERCDALGIDSAHRIIEASSVTVSEPIAWAAGRDTHLAILESLAELAGFLPPYFDNDGILVLRATPNLASAPASTVYGPGTNVVSGTIVASSDILSAPNRYVVIDGSAQDVALVGTYDIPDEAPNSFANRGFYITTTSDLQGLADQTAADAAAHAAYASAPDIYTWLAFTSTPDPRQDTWDIIEFDGVHYLQTEWEMELVAGGAMTHELRSVYVAGEVSGWV